AQVREALREPDQEPDLVRGPRAAAREHEGGVGQHPGFRRGRCLRRRRTGDVPVLPVLLPGPRTLPGVAPPPEHGSTARPPAPPPPPARERRRTDPAARPPSGSAADRAAP